MIGIYKKSDAPRKGGWCPGNYAGKCCLCKESFIGNKRSHTCADCAYKDIDTTVEKEGNYTLEGREYCKHDLMSRSCRFCEVEEERDLYKKALEKIAASQIKEMPEDSRNDKFTYMSLCYANLRQLADNALKETGK